MKVRQEQHGRKTTITLDLAGRQIREDAVAPTDVERLAHDALEGMKEERTLVADRVSRVGGDGGSYANPFLVQAAPKFVGKYERENDGKKKKNRRALRQRKGAMKAEVQPEGQIL